MLVSTFLSYFEGRKALFEKLAIEKLEKEWTEYPVLHLDEDEHADLGSGIKEKPRKTQENR